jgi:pimeloyl-ACP methyl ester carboxylesterase
MVLQVIAPSYRGHGDSDKPATGYTLDQLAQDVLAVADAAGAQRFVLVGFSKSGKFAQYIAAVHPQRVLGLVLIGPVPATEFSVPSEVGKAWCDAQHDRKAAFDQILAPFIKIPVKAELTKAFLDDFQKAARGGPDGGSAADQQQNFHSPPRSHAFQ